MKQNLDDPVVVQGESGTKWLVQPLPGGAVRVLGISKDFSPGEQFILNPGDSTELMLKLYFMNSLNYKSYKTGA